MAVTDLGKVGMNAEVEIKKAKITYLNIITMRSNGRILAEVIIDDGLGEARAKIFGITDEQIKALKLLKVGMFLSFSGKAEFDGFETHLTIRVKKYGIV